MKNLPIDWDSVPEVMNKEQFFRICHISRSTALHLLKSKRNGLNRKSKEDKEKMRTIKRNLKSENPAYKFSAVLAVIAVVLAVVFALSI